MVANKLAEKNRGKRNYSVSLVKGRMWHRPVGPQRHNSEQEQRKSQKNESQQVIDTRCYLCRDRGVKFDKIVRENTGKVFYVLTIFRFSEHRDSGMRVYYDS